MNKSEGFGGIPQKGRWGKQQPEIRVNPEVLALKNLLDPLVENHGKNVIMRYIEENTLGEIGLNVIENWLSEEHIPSPAIQRQVLSALSGFKSGSLPSIKKSQGIVKGGLVFAPEGETTKKIFKKSAKEIEEATKREKPKMSEEEYQKKLQDPREKGNIK